MKKVKVGPLWSVEERKEVANLIQQAITTLKQEERAMRKTIKWEAPYFSENAIKRRRLEELHYIVNSYSKEFLELNKGNFREFVE